MYFKTSLNVFQELIRYLAQSGSNASGLVKALSVLSVLAQVSISLFVCMDKINKDHVSGIAAL